MHASCVMHAKQLLVDSIQSWLSAGDIANQQQLSVCSHISERWQVSSDLVGPNVTVAFCQRAHLITDSKVSVLPAFRLSRMYCSMVAAKRCTLVIGCAEDPLLGGCITSDVFIASTMQ